MDSYKKLYRSRTNRMIAGVAGGIAEYLSMDPTVIRIIAVLFIFAGIGIPAYIIGWIIIPEDPIVPETTNKESTMPTNKPVAHHHQPATDESPKASESTTHQSNHSHHHGDNQKSRAVIGITLVALGTAFLIQETLGWNIWSHAWPVILIVIGLIIMLKRR